MFEFAHMEQGQVKDPWSQKSILLNVSFKCRKKIRDIQNTQNKLLLENHVIKYAKKQNLKAKIFQLAMGYFHLLYDTKHTYCKTIKRLRATTHCHKMNQIKVLQFQHCRFKKSISLKYTYCKWASWAWSFLGILFLI